MTANNKTFDNFHYLKELLVMRGIVEKLLKGQPSL